MLLPLLLTPLAMAGLFAQRSSMGSWPERQVERDYVMPKGWFQAGIALDSKTSTGYRDAAGAYVPYGDGTAWHYTTATLEVDQGFSRKIRLYARVPQVWAGLENDRGADITTTALGDIRTGFWVQPWIGRDWSAAFRLELKSPSGCEWPADLVGGPSSTSSFLTGTGITNLAPHLHGAWRFGRVARVAGQAGYVWKFPAVVGYILETGGWGYGWLNPGNEILLQGDATVQVMDDLALGGWGRWSRRNDYAMGTKGPGGKLDDLVAMEGTGGAYTDVGAILSYEPMDHAEVQARASYQVAGSDTRTFANLGLEEYSPQPGITWGLTGVVRW